MNWEIVIGIESHVQLKTATKIFSPASTLFGGVANSHVDAIDLSLPGTLPLLNSAIVKAAITFGLAVQGTINPCSIFARKHYFYPDLPKGYQISQFSNPIIEGGHVSIDVGNIQKKIPLTRAHLEEDAGKSLHLANNSGIDLNRAGTPLLEVVTEPVLLSAQEAVEYARTLHALVVWLDICDGNMQEGSFRCDANVSIRKPGAALGIRTELKNLNSFRFLEQAINIEVWRQIDILESGGHIVQETRLFDSDKVETRAMRGKENSHDYRYFPDPDLLPLLISSVDIAQINLPPLPQAAKKTLIDDFQLSEYDSEFLIQNRHALDFFYTALDFYKGGKIVDFSKILVNLMNTDLWKLLNENNVSIKNSEISPKHLYDLAICLENKSISHGAAKKIMQFLWQKSELTVSALIEQQGLIQISDTMQLQSWVSQAISCNPTLVNDYTCGKEKAFNALVGQVMKMSQGKASPSEVSQLLKRKLS